MEFAKSLQEKLGEHEPNEVDELILDELYENVDSFTTDHKKTLELYKNLVHLSLNGLGLKSLTNFPKIENLQILEVRQNQLNGNDFTEIKNLYPHLYKIKVGENPIKSLDVLKVFNGTSIKKIELTGTDAASKPTYREDLFKLLKNVETIDNKDRSGQDIDSTIYDEEGDEDFGEEDFEEGDFEDEEFEDDEDEDFEEDEEEESEKPKKKSKN